MKQAQSDVEKKCIIEDIEEEMADFGNQISSKNDFNKEIIDRRVTTVPE